MTMHARIELNPKIMLGKPVIRGTRIPVELILRKLGEGATEQDLFDAYPGLVAEDKDFGQLVFAAARASGGVILLRFPFSERSSVAPRLLELVRAHPHKLAAHFVVLQPSRTRFTRLP